MGEIRSLAFLHSCEAVSVSYAYTSWSALCSTLLFLVLPEVAMQLSLLCLAFLALERKPNLEMEMSSRKARPN